MGDDLVMDTAARGLLEPGLEDPQSITIVPWPQPDAAAEPRDPPGAGDESGPPPDRPGRRPIHPRRDLV